MTSRSRRLRRSLENLKMRSLCVYTVHSKKLKNISNMEELNRITKEAQHIRLTIAERSRIRTHLLAHMEKHPPVAPLASPYLSFFYAHPALRGGAFAFALVLMVGGGGAP